MLKGFYNTDKKWIVEKSKELFNIDVCSTCHGQLVDAYNKLNTYYTNIEMAKKADKKNSEETPKYKLKPEFVGSTYVNGKTSISLSDVPHDSIEIFFNELQIKEYFERV